MKVGSQVDKYNIFIPVSEEQFLVYNIHRLFIRLIQLPLFLSGWLSSDPTRKSIALSRSTASYSSFFN